jgi:DNA-damage-inducible protein D
MISMEESSNIEQASPGHVSPFERIKRTSGAGAEYWSSRDFAAVLDYGDYRNFEAVIEKAKLACFNSGHRVEDHFVDVTEMVRIGSGADRPIKTIFLSRYACYLAVQNADPKKDIVALGQTYFAVQTRRQELADHRIEGERGYCCARKCAGITRSWPMRPRARALSNRLITLSFRITAIWASMGA